MDVVTMKRWDVRACLTIGALAGMWIPAPGALQAQPAAPTEYEVKAAFLYNFAKFVEWPSRARPNKGDAFVIGILGQDPFGKDLEDQLNGKAVQDKKLVFIRLSNFQEASGCQVVFISSSKADDLGTILGTLRGPPVLTVSDMDRFVQRGGMVGFPIEDNRVRFNINLAAADQAGLKISSQLLKLAKT